MVKSIQVLATIFTATIGASSAFIPPNAAQNAITRSTPTQTVLDATIDTFHMSFGSSGSSVVLDRPTVERRKRLEPARNNDLEDEMTPDEWALRIYNDNINSREYVARCLVQLVCLNEERAFNTMMNAHENGIAVVGEYRFEVAEMYENLLGNNGIKCDVVSLNEC